MKLEIINNKSLQGGNKLKIKAIFSTLLLSVGLLTACGNGDGSEATGNSENSGGTVDIDGSSTVFPIMEAVSEEFAGVNPDVKAPVGVSGTGGGFEKFINGETDINNASRPIKDEEKQQLEEKGIEYTEFELAYDGISVVVHKDNDFVDQLTVDELKKIWVENEDITTWADIREGWPEEPIKFYSPGTDSGTYDYFDEVILDGEQMRKNATLSEDDNMLVQGVAGSEYAIGYFGYAYYVENQDKLKVVPIVNESGEAVTPSLETIQSGEYSPLSRPMYFYVNNQSIKDNDYVYEYVKFALENVGTLAEEVGYVSLPEEKYQEALKKLEELRN